MQVVREIRQEEASVRARINNTKHLTENSRLNDIQLLFSTLEQQQLGEVFQDEDAELDNEIDSQFMQYQARSALNQRDKSGDGKGGSSHQSTGSHIVEKVWRSTLSTIFKINSMMLNNQGVTPLSYHLILLFEFFQMLYYVLYKVNFVNEFEPAYNTHSNTTMSNNSIA